MDTIRGTLMGMEWVELPLGAAPKHYFVGETGTRDGPIVLITAPGQVPEKWIGRLSTGEEYDSGWSSYLKSASALRPFNEAEAFPHARVAYYSHGFDKFEIDPWARSVVEVPDGIDVVFTYEHYEGRISVEATTLKDGAITKVRRKIPSDVPFVEAASRIIGYFHRNCPRVPEGYVVVPTCGSHVNRILSGLNAMGVETVRRWLARPMRDAPHPERAMWQANAGRRMLTITSEMMPDETQIVSMSLTRTEQSTAVRCDFTVKGPHRVLDDLQGSTVTISATFPDTIMNALKGRDLADVIGADWARGMKVRTARIEDGMVVLRTYSEQQTLDLPDVVEDPTETERRLRLLVEDGENSMRWINEDAKPVLAAMTPAQLLAVMTTLKATQRVELADHGAPGWVLRSGMLGIEVEQCPIGEMKDVVQAVLGKG